MRHLFEFHKPDYSVKYKLESLTEERVHQVRVAVVILDTEGNSLLQLKGPIEKRKWVCAEILATYFGIEGRFVRDCRYYGFYVDWTRIRFHIVSPMEFEEIVRTGPHFAPIHP